MQIVSYDTPFDISRAFEPKGDQAKAIEQLCEGVEAGYRYQTLLGATGTGKTFTMASVIQRLQRPALVMAHNKTLAAQLCQEFRFAIVPIEQIHGLRLIVEHDPLAVDMRADFGKGNVDRVIGRGFVG